MIILSNNQWKYDKNNETWAAMGEDCSAETRSVGLLRAYTDLMPDLMGWQEVSPKMADLLMDDLRELPGAKYEYISGGDTPMVYRRDKYRLLESGFYLYPEAVPGYEGSFNNGETKSYCFGVFRDRETGKTFVAASTHLWWKSSHPEVSFYQPHSGEARAYQIGLVMARVEELMAKYSCPGVILGDFNASVNSLCFDAVRAGGWQEVHDLATDERDETVGHHPCGPNGFSPMDDRPFSAAIDHIIVKGDCSVKRFCRYMPEWLDKVTDHYPLYTEIEF